MATVRRLLAWVVAFGLGLLLGPVLVAAVTGLAASSDEQARWRNAYRLLSAYDERYPQYSLSTRDWQGAATDCGYDFEQLFGGPTPRLAEGREWTPFRGYFDLIMHQSAEFREEVQRRRTEHLTQQLSTFELTFLNRCLRGTVFAGVCGRRVASALEQAGLTGASSLPADGPHFDQTRESTTLCRYLDGLAARQGRPLASPPSPSATR